MLYAHVTDGAIDASPRQLPQRWRRGAGTTPRDYAEGVSLDRLLEAGWYPVEEVREPLGADQVYGDVVVAISVNKVTYTYPARDLTVQELAARAQNAKDEAMGALGPKLAILVQALASQLDEVQLSPRERASLATIRDNM